MDIAVTGATGFLGKYVVNHLLGSGHRCRCWHRPASDRSGFTETEAGLDWVLGELGDTKSATKLLEGTDAVVHCALHHPGGGFRGGEGNLEEFVAKNVGGTIQLIETARRIDVKRFVFISTCAVHEVILEDRPLDEAHPLWATSHYGAHKAAIEKFVHSYGLGHGYDICALRPTGIYGVAHPAKHSRWYDLVKAVAAGEPIRSSRGGKEVHAADVARAVEILLTADGVAGQAYNCYDTYVAEQDVARIAKAITGSRSEIADLNRGPKHQIETGKLRALGMTFGGRRLLETTIADLAKSLS
ncbi:MAG: NAD(P)-dependent oxidoreductase [Phycisphaerales bacterium]|nr:MAG: NAD(P)-dependent oxidoreductase [Phycisphaerales bacterium]